MISSVGVFRHGKPINLLLRANHGKTMGWGNVEPLTIAARACGYAFDVSRCRRRCRPPAGDGHLDGVVNGDVYDLRPAGTPIGSCSKARVRLLTAGAAHTIAVRGHRGRRRQAANASAPSNFLAVNVNWGAGC